MTSVCRGCVTFPLHSFFPRQEHTRVTTRSSYLSGYGVKSFSWHQRARILFHLQANKSPQAIGSECRSGVSQTKNIKILILCKKVMAVFPGVVDPDSVGLASFCRIRIRIGIQGLPIPEPDPYPNLFQPNVTTFCQKISIHFPCHGTVGRYGNDLIFLETMITVLIIPPP